MNKKVGRVGAKSESTWKEGTGFFKGQQWIDNKDGTVDIKSEDGKVKTWEKRDWKNKSLKTLYRTIDKKTGKVQDIYEDIKKYQILEHDTSIGALERKGASLEPSLAKKVKKKGGGYIKKYAKGSIVRKVRV